MPGPIRRANKQLKYSSRGPAAKNSALALFLAFKWQPGLMVSCCAHVVCQGIAGVSGRVTRLSMFHDGLLTGRFGCSHVECVILCPTPRVVIELVLCVLLIGVCRDPTSAQSIPCPAVGRDLVTSAESFASCA
jgi:hypothetical protein